MTTTTKRTELVAVAANGERFFRVTARDFKFFVYLEEHLSDGSIQNNEFGFCLNAERAAIKKKYAAKVAARIVGTEVCRWDSEAECVVSTGLIREEIRVACVPVERQPYGK